MDNRQIVALLKAGGLLVDVEFPGNIVVIDVTPTLQVLTGQKGWDAGSVTEFRDGMWDEVDELVVSASVSPDERDPYVIAGAWFRWVRVEQRRRGLRLKGDDPTELMAHQMQHALTCRGVRSYVHWDRSPWGVRIPLTTDHDEFAPALFVTTEGRHLAESGPTAEAIVWDGTLRIDAEDGELETQLTWHTRPWLQQGIHAIAKEVSLLLPVLTHGVRP